MKRCSSRLLAAAVASVALLAGCATTSGRAPSTPAVTVDAPITHPDPEARQYLEDVRTAIRRGWTYPCVWAQSSSRCTYPEGKVVLVFRIAWDGALVSTEVDTPSGYPELDTAATEAVKSAAPFPPVPAALKRPGKGIPIRANMIYRDGHPGQGQFN